MQIERKYCFQKNWVLIKKKHTSFKKEGEEHFKQRKQQIQRPESPEDLKVVKVIWEGTEK